LARNFRGAASTFFLQPLQQGPVVIVEVSSLSASSPLTGHVPSLAAATFPRNADGSLSDLDLLFPQQKLMVSAVRFSSAAFVPP
jgi:hypothetical protein